MKLFKNIIAIIFILLVSVIVFFTFNLLFSALSNYQSPSKYLLTSIPMLMFMCELIIGLFRAFGFFVLKRRDVYFYRKFAIMTLVCSVIGFLFSILCGTYIYGTFFGDSVFTAYPFVMLCFHSLGLISSSYWSFISIKEIVSDKPQRVWKNPKLYWLRELFIGEMLVFALERLGGFVLLPTYFSSYDSIYVIPVYLQLLIPTLIFVTYMIHEHWLHNRKVTIILSSIALGYTLMSMTYMLIMASVFKENYPMLVNPLSPVMQLERLVTFPVGFIVLYGFSILVPALNLLNNVIMAIKEKKAN